MLLACICKEIQSLQSIYAKYPGTVAKPLSAVEVTEYYKVFSAKNVCKPNL